MAFFRKGPGAETPPESPALLFRDLRRDPSVKFLWGHQQQVLDAFRSTFLNQSDVALELPTGSGKTLVGLLIAEYRRRAEGLRSAFLCPTKQLAAQVHNASLRYGTETVLLVGRQSEWPAADFTRYQRAQAVAVTTYSALFNTNPKLDDPELLICDDAHAADHFVGDLWTVRLQREEDKEAFLALYRTVAPLLPEAIAQRIEHDAPTATEVDLVSTIALLEHGGRVKETLDAVLSKEQRYPYSKIVDYLHACNLYASASSFEIGPIIPPTRTHAPFARAKQRVYMSATLGDDGSIERAFGITKLSRLPIPEGWDKRGTGRRLILFPGLGIDENDELGPWDITHRILQERDRSLVLVPSMRTRGKAVERLKGTHRVLGPADIENNLDAFTTDPGPVALIVANRFDGIDLPGDACRCMVIDGLPDAAGLHESYLVYRLGASALLRDRIRTRLTQAVGRCTRDESDYAAVLVLGDDLLKWFSTKPNVRGMHPEIQAEIEFGFENSQDRRPEDFSYAVRLLIDRDAEWNQAETRIREIRNAATKIPDPEAGALSNSAPFEVEYLYALWDNRLDDAIENASRAVDALSGGTELRSYRSFWHHQSAVAAYLAWKGGDQTRRAMCLDQLNRAGATSSGVRWLGRLQTALAVEVAAPPDPIAIHGWYQQLSQLLTSWGLRGPRFKQKIQEAEAQLADFKNTTSIEQALETLGQMLGFRAKRWPSQHGAPDGLWWIDEWAGFTFEAKFGATNLEISLDDLRQTVSHPNFVRHEQVVPASLPLHVVLASDQSRVHRDARGLTKDVTQLHREELGRLFSAAAMALERLRTSATDLTAEAASAAAWRIYEERGITPQGVATLLRTRPLSALP